MSANATGVRRAQRMGPGGKAQLEAVIDGVPVEPGEAALAVVAANLAQLGQTVGQLAVSGQALALHLGNLVQLAARTAQATEALVAEVQGMSSRVVGELGAQLGLSPLPAASGALDAPPDGDGI